MSFKTINFTMSLISAICVFTHVAIAAVPKAKAPFVVQRQIGGQAGAGFSLLGLQKMESKNNKIERLVFSIGTREGQNLKGAPGYFNAQNQKNRIVLDFSQMPLSRVSEKTLREILKDSKYVKSARMLQDPSDQTLTLVLDLKSPVKMRTLQIKGQKQTARVVLDIIKP